MSDYILELCNITKIFPGVKALDGVNFQLKAGEIHALMGENGAGKSTFIKVITGVHHADGGTMFLDGKKVEFKSPLDAQRAGIAATHSESCGKGFRHAVRSCHRRTGSAGVAQFEWN